MIEHENVGYLDWATWVRLQNAVQTVPTLCAWLRAAGNIRNLDPNETRAPSREAGTLLPGAWIAADTIDRLHAQLRAHGTLEKAVNRGDGVIIALDLIREVETAIKRWPIQDEPHELHWIRCAQCDKLTVQYLPPRHAGDHTVYKCTSCGALESPEQFSARAKLVLEESDRKEAAADQWITVAGACKRFGRAARTIYEWIAEGNIDTIRPARTMWVNVQQLAEKESQKSKRIGVSH